MKYDFQAIEKKWQARWETEKPFAAVTGDPRPKFYGTVRRQIYFSENTQAFNRR